MEIVVGFIFTAIGSLIAGGTLFIGGCALRKQSHWRRTHGTVVGNDERIDDNKRKLVAPIVEFITHEGQSVRFTSGMATSWRSYKPGASVPVIYNPRVRDEAEIISFARRYLSALTFVLIGGVFLTIGINLLRKEFR